MFGDLNFYFDVKIKYLKMLPHSVRVVHFNDLMVGYNGISVGTEVVVEVK